MDDEQSNLTINLQDESLALEVPTKESEDKLHTNKNEDFNDLMLSKTYEFDKSTNIPTENETSEEEDVDQTTDDTLTKRTIKSDAEQLDNIIREQVKGKDITDSRGQC
ncbi:unnamed protein product, partial [Rotaria sordida]